MLHCGGTASKYCSFNKFNLELLRWKFLATKLKVIKIERYFIVTSFMRYKVVFVSHKGKKDTFLKTKTASDEKGGRDSNCHVTTGTEFPMSTSTVGFTCLSMV